ncbi:hypothetical protein A7978_05675 (plasmid) [Borrelia turicatae]|uniref:Lipoprotein n=1 Tax=Borrelia turicatae TaxID=142 RepID=A0A172XD93_BORTU|nr:hypothetical protein [Borrelia turicatae]ANF34528.1 hypothetical protein A7978_05675 [Borrelia turicatae]UPA15653.1 hypothetical protein btBTE5EL_001360 [Borrelia turicatae]
MKKVILYSLIAFLISCGMLRSKDDNQNTPKALKKIKELRNKKDILFLSNEETAKFNSLKNALASKISTTKFLKKYENKFKKFITQIESDLPAKLALAHAFSTAYDLIKIKVPESKTFDTFVSDAIKCSIPDDNKYIIYEGDKAYYSEEYNNRYYSNNDYNSDYYNGTDGIRCQVKDDNRIYTELFFRHISIDAFDNGVEDNETILNTLLTSLISEEDHHLGLLRRSN